MGNDFSLQLREDSLMTKIMLKQEDQVIEHIEQANTDIQHPLNQMGDTILHYAAYHSLKKLIEYLLEKGADPYYLNNRSLAPIDVAIPEIREWIIRRKIKLQNVKKEENFSSKSKKEESNELLIINNRKNSKQ